jgi:hypothetical protein
VPELRKKWKGSSTSSHLPQSGMGSQRFLVDSSGVNVHGTIPVRWVTLAMLLLNLVVWLDAAAQLAG